MKTILEIDWVRLDNQKGAILVADDGIYFQPYGTKKTDYPFGDSMAIQVTGVIGALNLHKKLSEEEDPPVVAQNIRESMEMEELVKNNLLVFFGWDCIAKLKKGWFGTPVVITMKDGREITIRNQHTETVFECVSSKIAKQEG